MKRVIVMNKDKMGHGNPELGQVLMGAFLKKAWARPDKPDMILLYNTGVLLLQKEAGFMDALLGLEEAGVEILACGTCLEAYDLKETMVAGRVSSMEEILDIMMRAESVITL